MRTFILGIAVGFYLVIYVITGLAQRSDPKGYAIAALKFAERIGKKIDRALN